MDATQPSPASAQTYREKLKESEEHWLWKLILRSIIVVVALIGVGCFGWIIQSANDHHYIYDNETWTVCWTLITFGVSILWCLTCILVLLLRRPPKPVHPGVAVGLDLVLWLAYIPTLMFAILAVTSALDFGSSGYINRYSSDGYYWQAPNGTWVYNQTDYDIYYNRTRDCTDSDYYGYYHFASCADEDAYVNQMWREKSRRVGVEMTGTVCQGLGLILHFALFVWACVDTARRNRMKTNKEAEKLAANIVMNMVNDGMIVRGPNTMQGGGYPQYMQQNAYPPQMQQQRVGSPNGGIGPVSPPQGTAGHDQKGENFGRYA